MYSLTVTIHGNPDRNQGDWEESHTLSATNLPELIKVVRDFQGDNQIGGGNWGEAVLSSNGRKVGFMSYNGRVWDRSCWSEDAKEIIL